MTIRSTLFLAVSLSSLVCVCACGSSDTSNGSPGDGGASSSGGSSSSGSSSGAGSSGGSSSGGSSGGSSGVASDAGPEGGGSSSGGDGGALSCSAYCTTIAANCTGANQQYPNAASCAGECPNFPVGTAADTMGDTLGCRTYHATLAASLPATHCEHAGPTGGAESGTIAGPCGDGCEAFCDVAQAVCTGPLMQFADKSTCMTACKTFAANKTTPYSVADTASNDFGCRVYHLSLAASSPANATTHCPHIVPGSTVCTM